MEGLQGGEISLDFAVMNAKDLEEGIEVRMHEISQILLVIPCPKLVAASEKEL